VLRDYLIMHISRENLTDQYANKATDNNTLIQLTQLVKNIRYVQCLLLDFSSDTSDHLLLLLEEAQLSQKNRAMLYVSKFML